MLISCEHRPILLVAESRVHWPSPIDSVGQFHERAMLRAELQCRLRERQTLRNVREVHRSRLEVRSFVLSNHAGTQSSSVEMR